MSATGPRHASEIATPDELPGLDFDLSGTDPYDALMSPRIPRFMRGTRRMRQAAIQLRKLTPIDLAPVLGIQPYTMAKSVGCALAAVARAAVATGRTQDPAVRVRTEQLVVALDRCPGTIGDGSFGYEFDVQTRWAFYPAGSANVIATVFVARGLLEAGLSFDRAEWVERAAAAGEWIDANLFEGPKDAPFYSYVPGSGTLVHNASLLAASACCLAGTLAERPEMVERGLQAVSTSIGGQRSDGSWPYGEGEGLEWADNFHTAYNLDALHLVWRITGAANVRSALEAGLDHWTRNFFGPQGQPRYYAGKDWPVDIHCGATAVDIAARLAAEDFPCEDVARMVDRWTRDNMLRSESATMFRRYMYLLDKRRFPRWGDAHWAMARGSMMLLEARQRGPLERLYCGDPT